MGRKATPPPSEEDFRFTVANGALYAFGYKVPVADAKIVSLAAGRATVEKVSLAGSSAALKFKQTNEGLMVSLPAMDMKSRMPYGLRIQGTIPLGVS
jgi:alpha-L-fucosidase